MTTIRFNDHVITLEENLSLADLLLQKGYVDGPYAVSLNRQFIPKTALHTIMLNDHDHIEMITPMQGG